MYTFTPICVHMMHHKPHSNFFPFLFEAPFHGVAKSQTRLSEGNQSIKKSLQCGGSVVRNPPASAVDVDSILGSGRSLGVENGNPLQYSCLDRRAWWAIVYEVSESDMTQQLKQQKNSL